MGRKKSRDSYTSKKESDRGFNQFDAYLKGKNVILTVPNPLKTETNKPYIKVKAKHYWKRASSE